MFTRRPPSHSEAQMADGMPPPRIPSSPGNQTSALLPGAVEGHQPQCEDGIVIVGRGTRVSGKIGDCRMLDVHGVLEADVLADFLVIREGGGIKGVVQSASARVHGVFEGTLLVQDHLEIQSTGQVTGDVSYRTLAIQAGARLRGNITCSEPELSPDSQEAADPPSNVIPILGVAGEVVAAE